jgi:hypothetical protein
MNVSFMGTGKVGRGDGWRRVRGAQGSGGRQEGLKPLATSQRPSDSSHRKIGMVAIADQTETWP